MPATKGRCLVSGCEITSSTVWGRSPDGQRTLCGLCYGRYYGHRLPLYMDTRTGRLSVVRGPNTRKMLVTGFHPVSTGSTRRDLSRPIVEFDDEDDEDVPGARVEGVELVGFGGGQIGKKRKRISIENEAVQNGQVHDFGEDTEEDEALEVKGDEGEVALFCYSPACNGSTVLKRWRGPDGDETLCSECFERYGNQEFVLYELGGGYSVVPREGWKTVKVIGFEGDFNLDSPIVEDLDDSWEGKWWTVGRGGVVTNGECVRCRKKDWGWMGPDGWGSLCEECWKEYAGGGMVLWRTASGALGLRAGEEGEEREKVVVVGWRRHRGGDVDWRNPIVERFDGKKKVGQVIEEEWSRDKHEQGYHDGTRGYQKQEKQEDDGLEVDVRYRENSFLGRVGTGTCFTGFCRALSGTIGMPKGRIGRALQLRYEDDEGDLITLRTWGDVVEMVAVIRKYDLRPVVIWIGDVL